MNEDDMTTISLSIKMRDRLEKRKIHPRQSYEEVVEDLLNITETDLKPKEE